MRGIYCQKCGGKFSDLDLLYFGFQREYPCKKCQMHHMVKKWLMRYDVVYATVLSVLLAYLLLFLTQNAFLYMALYFVVWICLYILGNQGVLLFTNDIFIMKKQAAPAGNSE